MPHRNVKERLLSAWKSRGIEHAVRTGIGAAASLVAARFMGLPEAYWAPLTTLIVMQSTLKSSWTISLSYFIGTALGAAMGALWTSYVEPWVGLFGAGMFGLGIIGLGLVCIVLRLDEGAYRFANVTFAIITLISSANSPWHIALHRFIEVMLGIAVALILTAPWPERELMSVSERS